MRFVHRTVTQLLGISAVPTDPLHVLDGVPLEQLDADWTDHLRTLGLVDLALTADLTLNQSRFAEVDQGLELADRILSGFASAEREPRTVADRQAERASQATPDAWLVVDVAGDDSSTRTAGFPDVVADVGASWELLDSPSNINALNGARGQVLNDLIIGAVRVAARHPVEALPVARRAWQLRPDGVPHHRSSLGGSGRGHVGKALPADVADEARRVLDGAQADPRLAAALSAYGRSVSYHLDPALCFLSAFAGLELVVKVRSNSSPYAQGKRPGLAKKFAGLVGATDPDSDTFDRLYAERNGLAHEANFGAPDAVQTRRLFDRQLRSALGLAP